MTITVEIPDDVEKKIQESVVSGDIKTAQSLVLEAVFPTVKDSIVNNTAESQELSYEEFKALANKLVETFMEYVGPDCPPLSDYATSREGIYEDHL